METRHISKLALPSHSVAEFSLVNKTFQLCAYVHTETSVCSHNNFSFCLSFSVAISFILLSHVPIETLGGFVQKIYFYYIVPRPK